MASEKYTETQSAQIAQIWQASDKSEQVIQSLSEQFGRSTRSIVAKLAQLGIYSAKAKVETGVTKRTKLDLTREIETALALDQGTLESLEKGSKAALEALVTAIEGQKAE